MIEYKQKRIGGAGPARSGRGAATGVVGRLESGSSYRYRWFDPIGGTFVSEGVFTAADATRRLGERPRATDMALLIKKL